MPIPITLKVFKDGQLLKSKDFALNIIKIGRLASAHLCLDDDKVSRIHAAIDTGADGSSPSIVDMGSVEGTYVNGKRVTKAPLAFGDEIKLGNTVVRFEKGGQKEAVAESPPPAGSATTASPPPPPEEAGVITTQSEIPAGKPGKAGARRPMRGGATGPLGLEIRLMWGDQQVAEHFLSPHKASSFTIGSAPGVDFAMGDANLAGPKFEVVRGDGHGFTLRFTAKMSGELLRRGEEMDLKRLIESGAAPHDGDGYGVSLQSEDFARVDLGGVTIEVAFQEVPKPILYRRLESIDFTALNIFLVVFFLGAFFVITALNRETEGAELSDELSSTQARIAKLIVRPPDLQKNPILEKFAKQKDQGEMAAKHRGDEGAMGKKDGPKRNTRAAPKGDPNNKDQARLMAQRIFGSGGQGISSIFGHNGLGGELKSAMGHMFGTTAGDAQGFGGLGLRGTGSGGGGVGDTIGIGGIGTKGRGGGTGSYGTGVGTLGAKKTADISITSSEPMVMGSLDKELIRQVIHRNRGQIRYCYESQLTRYPKLSGKVAVKFVISPNGTVTSSQVHQTTVDNAELETCVAGRVRTWLFPKPKGGGVVIVTYPFIFKQSGD